jgi:ABC-2 type transport system permease protein
MDLVKRLIRISGFVVKEVREIWRQPRLLLSLLLGPFLILLLFGAGYVGTSLKLRAIVVIPDTPAFTEQKEAVREQFSKGVELVDITSDLDSAKARLTRGEVKAVIAVPADAAEKIGGGAQAIVPVYYNEVDPVTAGQIVLGTLNYTNDLNKETVAAAFKEGQSGAGNVKEALARIDGALGQISEDIGRGDSASAQGRILEVRTSADVVALSAGLMLQLLKTSPVTTGATDEQVQNLTQTEGSVRNLNADVSALQQELAATTPDPTRVRDRTEAVRRDVRDLQAITTQFESMNPYVLAAPFYGKAENLAGEPTFLNYYTPAVIALLLQHIALTLGRSRWCATARAARSNSSASRRSRRARS